VGTRALTYLLTQLTRTYEAGNISETVRAKATIIYNGLYLYKAVHGLSFAAKVYDLEWPLLEIQYSSLLTPTQVHDLPVYVYIP